MGGDSVEMREKPLFGPLKVYAMGLPLLRPLKDYAMGLGIPRLPEDPGALVFNHGIYFCLPLLKLPMLSHDSIFIRTFLQRYI